MRNRNSKQRYCMIELLAWWEGRVCNSQLVHYFGISRQQAYADMKAYLLQNPTNLHRLDASGAYQPTSEFNPSYISTDVVQYLHWLQTNELPNVQKAPSFQEKTIVAELALPVRSVCVKVIRVLVAAIRLRKKIEVDYVSLSHPESDGRIFHPHTFVNTGLRWHIRGYCEKSLGYRDLVLSRFRGEAEVLADSDHGIEDDSAWQTLITLILQPDPRLTAEKQAVLANDYQMEGGQLTLTTRAALANYLLHEMQVNTKMLDGTPEAQQLVLVNRDDIEPWLFSR